MNLKNETNSDQSERKTLVQITHEHALKHPILDDASYQRTGYDPVLSKFKPLNNIYEISIVTAVVREAKDSPVFKWQFIATVRTTQTREAVMLSLLSKKLQQKIYEAVKEASAGVGIVDSEKMNRNRHVIRLERDLTEMERAELLENLAARAPEAKA